MPLCECVPRFLFNFDGFPELKELYFSPHNLTAVSICFHQQVSIWLTCKSGISFKKWPLVELTLTHIVFVII